MVRVNDDDLPPVEPPADKPPHHPARLYAQGFVKKSLASGRVPLNLLCFCKTHAASQVSTHMCACARALFLPYRDGVIELIKYEIKIRLIAIDRVTASHCLELSRLAPRRQ